MPPTVAIEGHLCLVDAHAYLHRAYHALPPLTTSSGEPVGALYGFTRMLSGLLKREKPEFVAVCFDSPGPTFRHKAYAQYKATRKEIDEDLRSQLALARPLAEAMGLRCVAIGGFEADDLMATITTQALGHGCKDVLIVTSDKDAMQLVGDRVKVLSEPKKDLFDAGKVAEKFGVRPDQIVDYLTLVGDSSDNVPGVPGIGAVGAAKLLTSFGTLEALWKAAHSGDAGLPAKTAQTLRDSEKQARLSRDLIMLRREAPVDLRLEDFRVSPAHRDQLLALFKRFEFNSLAQEMSSEPSKAVAAGENEAPNAPVREPAPPMDIKAWLKVAAKTSRVSVALYRMPRTDLFQNQDGKDWNLAVALSDGRAAWLKPEDLTAQQGALSKVFTTEVEWMGHDLKEILVALNRCGISVAQKRFDTLLAAYCINPSRSKYDFAALTAEYGIAYARNQGSKEDPRPAVLEQARAVFDLSERLKEELKKKEVFPLYENLEMPLLDILAAMEMEGIGIDHPYLENLKVEFEARIADLKREIDKMAGREVNLNSPKQLATLLFEDLKLPVMHKTPKGGVSTDEETLRALMALHPLPAKMIDYRELSKLKSTYIDGLLERMDRSTHRVHTHFNQAGTATGRLSSIDPNLQNIPIRTPMGQKIRRAFVARKGWVLVSADYSQIDLRVLAQLSQDPALVAAFKSGEDVHLKTACEIFDLPASKVDAEMRRRAKAVNFGIVYGQTAHGLSQELGITRADAQEYIQRYLSRYAGVARWSKETLERARLDGYVKTILGRVRYLPDLAAKNAAVRQFNERVAVNTPIQGSSADIIKKAMINIHHAMEENSKRWKSRMMLQVHDELLFESPEQEAREFGQWARKEMESAVRFDVPLVVDVKTGANWQEMKRV